MTECSENVIILKVNGKILTYVLPLNLIDESMCKLPGMTEDLVKYNVIYGGVHSLVRDIIREYNLYEEKIFKDYKVLSFPIIPDSFNSYNMSKREFLLELVKFTYDVNHKGINGKKLRNEV